MIVLQILSYGVVFIAGAMLERYLGTFLVEKLETAIDGLEARLRSGIVNDLSKLTSKL